MAVQEKTLDPVHGKTRFLLFRVLSKAREGAAAKLALQTEHEWSYERDVETTATKEGALTSSGALEVSLEITAIASRDAVNEMLFDAVLKDEVLEVWEVDLATKQSNGKYKAKYARGRLSEWTIPSSVEGFVELQTTMSIDGVPQDGEVTLTEGQLLAINEVYKFRDLAQVSD